MVCQVGSGFFIYRKQLICRDAEARYFPVINGKIIFSEPKSMSPWTTVEKLCSKDEYEMYDITKRLRRSIGCYVM